MNQIPRLLLCAPASGAGKTTMTCALLRALVDMGSNPVAFKCGPDYIDPMFHSEVIGAKSRNLDLFFMGRDTTRRLLWENAQGGGLALIEGVMGYYDGIGVGADASAYDLACATQTPAILVVDAKGRALSIAALVKGFLAFRPDSGIQGVLLNKVSPALYPQLKRALEAECGIRVYGYLPELPDCALESRHLGLVTASEVADLRGKIQKLAIQAEKTVELDALLALARTAPPLLTEPLALPAPVVGRPKIALARDKAFCFYYADSLALLEKLGAELVEFSPLEDQALPEGCSGLYLGGGYPELYTQRLSANKAMRGAVKAAIESGMPTVAECGGFLYLHRTLESETGVELPMAGIFPAGGTRTERLSRFGYVTLTAERDNLLCGKGETIPAHEFHYWESQDPGDDFTARKPQSDRSWSCIHGGPTFYLGFPHLHFCARPQAAARFVAACAGYAQSTRLS